jgi:Tfp pilus assembly protein PilN
MKAVNLLPSDQRSAGKAAKPASVTKTGSGDGFGAYVVLGALGLAVLGSAAFALTSNQVNDRESELARVTADKQAAEARVAALKPYGDFQQLAATRVSTVVSLASSRFDWDQTLADLSRALPADVRISKLDGKVGGDGASTGATTVPKIEITGCTTSHTGTARLMARLRAVRGVTRVVLTKSDKETLTQATVGTGASAGATGEQVGLCGRGAKPSFQVSMLFERANVLPTSSGAASAAPSGQTPAPGATPAPGTQAQQPGATQPASSTQPGNTTAPATTGGTP